MQQTETYKLGLIDKTDAFSPDTLNDNTRKVEEVLIAHRAEVKEENSALEARVTVLEGFKFTWDTYYGSMTDNRIINVGFTPVAVIVARRDGTGCTAVIADGMSGEQVIRIVNNGFQIMSTTGYNNEFAYYSYIAFGAVK